MGTTRGLRGAAVAASLMLAVCSLPACMAWKTQDRPPAAVVAAQPRRVRVVTADQRRIEIDNPRISGDSLIGKPARKGDTTAIGVPLADVRELAVRQTDAVRTGLLIAAGAGITAIIIAAATYDGPFDDSGEHSSQGTSCPLVYSWDGSRWRLDSGTFGGAIMPALARSDLDNLIYAVPRGGRLRLRVANELDEVDHLDALSVLAVDHEPGVSVAPDAEGRIHTIAAPLSPSRAHDFRGRDALARVSTVDGWSWESNPSDRDAGDDADLRDGLVLAFPRPAGSRQARLVVDGRNTPWAAYLIKEFVRAHGSATQAWYDSVAADSGMARRLGATMAEEGFLAVSLLVDGRWERQGFVWEAGPEIAKRQVLSLDVSGIAGDSVVVRLESATAFWLIDHVALDFSAPRSFTATSLSAAGATDRHGRDVRPLLEEADGQYYVMAEGDAAELEFRVPPVAQGLRRSYLVRSAGWYRINVPEVGEPDLPLLRAVSERRLGGSRAAVSRLNEALARLRGGA